MLFNYNNIATDGKQRVQIGFLVVGGIFIFSISGFLLGKALYSINKNKIGNQWSDDISTMAIGSIVSAIVSALINQLGLPSFNKEIDLDFRDRLKRINIQEISAENECCFGPSFVIPAVLPLVGSSCWGLTLLGKNPKMASSLICKHILGSVVLFALLTFLNDCNFRSNAFEVDNSSVLEIVNDAGNDEERNSIQSVSTQPYIPSFRSDSYGSNTNTVTSLSFSFYQKASPVTSQNNIFQRRV